MVHFPTSSQAAYMCDRWIAVEFDLVQLNIEQAMLYIVTEAMIVNTA